MSLSAQVVAELVAAGLAGQALIDACRRIEAADGATVAVPRAATVAINSRNNATVVRTADATVAPGAGAGRAPLAMLRAAIANTRGLSRGTARVGAAILDRYDPNTGRCEIGTDAISRACGLHRASVFRAIRALVGTGLLARASYAGMGHCNAYYPRFEALGLKPGVEKNATVATLRRSQECDPISDKDSLPPEKRESSYGGKRRRSAPDRRQTHLPLPIAGGLVKGEPAFKPTPDALRAKAAGRLADDLRARHGGRSIRQDPEAWEAGIQAEMRVPGTGLAAHDAVLEGQLRRGRTGTGPP